MASPTPLRRKPVQQRSAKRVEQMLESCAALIEEVGYDGVTTTLIAERAGVAVGSLYQFFPDKRAVVRELTRRNLERFLRLVGERFETTYVNHWWDAVDLAIDIYVDMHRTVPGFAKLHFGDVVDLELLDDGEGKHNNEVVSEQLAAIVAEKAGLPVEDLMLPITIAVEATDGIHKLAFRRDPRGDQTIIDEGKYLLRQYLSSKVGN
ncbi:AcrR family transcriptional regulator [Kibdelosporangium banguiense]|uniref:AcrR family transcriptional regulator n=1 Tax=Kibdelosporangium banguiense TaxID=1365924 RepID=A0ABS4TD69_9PSEU|nr:TetR family transcriptional regulator [Kibdelosporangium banguiense]MBP2321803.1 AcrR family transcriptional regulator [Kibdelosporangium banguiense]